MDMMERKKVFDFVCRFTFVWILVFSISAILVLLSLFSLLYVTPGTTPYYLTVANLLMLLPLTGVLYVVTDRCESSV